PQVHLSFPLDASRTYRPGDRPLDRAPGGGGYGSLDIKRGDNLGCERIPRLVTPRAQGIVEPQMQRRPLGNDDWGASAVAPALGHAPIGVAAAADLFRAAIDIPATGISLRGVSPVMITIIIPSFIALPKVVLIILQGGIQTGIVASIGSFVHIRVGK